VSEISFPLKDLVRRKYQTTLTVLGLAIATATTAFLVLFASNLGFEISVIAKAGRLTTGFTNIFSEFILIVSFLNLIIGPIVTSFLVHLTMAGRMKDIAIMKTCGCLTTSVFGYFATELSLLVFFSTAIGIIMGTLAFYSVTLLLSTSGFHVQQTINLWAILLTSIVTVIASHIFGAKPISEASKAKPTEAMSSIYTGDVTDWSRKITSKLGFTFKIAFRNLTRRKTTTIHATICLATVFTMTTVTLLGGMVANQTTISYAERAIGNNITIIGHSTVTENYVKLLNRFFEESDTQSVDYTSSEVLISESVVEKLSQITGIKKIDARLILEHSVREVPGIILDPVDQTGATIIGESRTDDALIVGINPQNVVNDWLVFGRKPDSTNEHSALIGDSLALNMFTDARNQKIKIFEDYSRPYEIVGICVDQLNNGKVVYLPLAKLYESIGHEGMYNIIFVQSNPSDKQLISQIMDTVSTDNLTVIELDTDLAKHVSFLNNIWSLVIFLPMFSVATVTLSLLSYVLLSVSEQKNDLSIMNALGATRKTIVKTVVTQFSLIILTSGAIGITVGALISFKFLIPNPVISQSTLSYAIIGILAILATLCTISVFPALKAGKKPVLEGV
jgi:ABC-type antimicrobial peptide transport system permease subunit